MQHGRLDLPKNVTLVWMRNAHKDARTSFQARACVGGDAGDEIEHEGDRFS